MTAATRYRLTAALIALVGALAMFLTPVRAHAQAAGQPPVFAYYYIWFDPSSWNRAKTDYPLLGRYSSDQTEVMRAHIEAAKAAGIDGFTVSWKDTPTLDRRLGDLIRVAGQEDFKLQIIYQGLDFERNPLPEDTVLRDMRFFQRRWGDSPVFDAFGEPVMIWSGTWEFSDAEIQTVTSGVHGLQLLASEKNLPDYLHVAGMFDGDAYYWSSVNPDTYPGYEDKLAEMGDAVHSHGGLWIAPAAPGFDARLIGGTTVVDRDDGQTLRREYDAAVQSSPDQIGLISWNEFSENSHVEPSVQYGTEALRTLADIRGAPAPDFTTFDFDSDAPAAITGGPSYRGVATIAALAALGILTLTRLARRQRDHAGDDDPELEQGEAGR